MSTTATLVGDVLAKTGEVDDRVDAVQEDIDAEGAPMALPEATDIMRAAGIMFIADGKVLILMRSAGSDHPGEWCFPGGKVEPGETALQAAIRETEEETGHKVKAEALADHVRTVREGVDFTTYISRCDEPFAVEIEGEHCGFMWAKPSELPPNLHPGSRIAINKLSWNELDLARAISAGVVTSPQRYMNMWLFDIRISGTGAAFRSAKGEFTYRDPSIYLTDEMLARCNGLMVIWYHTDGPMLNAAEFTEKAIGTVMLPYIKGDELWGVAKVYDDEAAAAMLSDQMSTSPGVMLRQVDENTHSLGGGATLIIEGNPVLVDHIAICGPGVWDKGREPAGINCSSGDIITMATEADDKEDRKDADEVAEKVEDKKDADGEGEGADESKKDAVTLDKVLAKMDAMCARMDAMEAPKKDADDADPDKDKPEPVADKKDEDEKKEGDDGARKDSAEVARLKADHAALLKRVETMAKAIPAHVTDSDYAQLSGVQARADSVMAGFGKAASRPLQGEGLGNYRRRVAADLQGHSPTWGKVDLIALPDAAFEIAETAIYKDAEAAAMHPVDLPAGDIRGIPKTDRDTGLRTTTFVGRNTFIAQMGHPSQRAKFTPRTSH